MLRLSGLNRKSLEQIIGGKKNMHLKAGDYYIGDLCYVLSDEDYDALVKLIISSNKEARWEGYFKGYRVFVAPTCYGDGVYADNDGDEYFVDSGTIGIVPEELIDSNNRADLGQIIEFRTDFEVSYDDGIFIFGDVVIDSKNFGIGAILKNHLKDEKEEKNAKR